MLEAAFEETSVIENDCSLWTLHFEFKFDDRINAGVPTARTPGLHDPLIGNEFYVSISVGQPSPKDETANKDDDPGEQALEKIENADCAGAHKVKESSIFGGGRMLVRCKGRLDHGL
jgi:hypothetical protein